MLKYNQMLHEEDYLNQNLYNQVLTQDDSSSLLSRRCAEGRWATFGPYYAMFPIDFALEAISKYSKYGDSILDPFAGRGTTLFASSMLRRYSTGIEISPLGWLYTEVKTNPASFNLVRKRLLELGKIAIDKYKDSYLSHDDFFRMCYSGTTLDFLVAAREELEWKTRKVDRTLMGFILIHLHGKHGASLSNQMQQVKACGARYAVKWWKEKGYTPPDINPVDLLLKKLTWRYEKGYPKFKSSNAMLGDSTKMLSRRSVSKHKYNLLLTSPPYYGITDYFYDQWIRLWLLGGAPQQKKINHPSKNSFHNKTQYYDLLYSVFRNSKKLLTQDATLYIRTDAREYTRNTTVSILEELFPEKKMEIIARPFKKRTQTALHGDTSKKPGEIDIILTP